MQIMDVPEAVHDKGIAHPRAAELDATVRQRRGHSAR